MHTFATINEAGLKAQAQLLKTFLQAKNAPLNHMTCLDAVSVQYGFPSWQHAKAALSANGANCRSPEDESEAQAKAVGEMLLAAGAVHEPTLQSWAQALLPRGPAPSFTAWYEKSVDSCGVDRDAWLKSSTWVGGKGQFHPTELLSILRLGLRFEAGVLYVLPAVHLEVLRDGYGEMEPSGWEEGRIEWTCYEADDEIGVVLSDPQWQKKLCQAVQAIPVADLLERALEGASLSGMAADLEEALLG